MLYPGNGDGQGQVNGYILGEIATASPIRLIGMLLARGSVLMAEAEQALRNQNLEQAHNSLSKAQQAVNGLMQAFDSDENNELSVNMRRLCLFIWERILQANLGKRVEPLLEARAIWQNLQDIWMEVESQQN